MSPCPQLGFVKQISIFRRTLYKFRCCYNQFSDLCKRQSRGSTYSSGFNCRSYYQCNEMGRSVAMCCTNKHSYNPDKGRCVYDESCDIDCTSRTPTERQKDLRVNLQVTETYDCKYHQYITYQPRTSPP